MTWVKLDGLFPEHPKVLRAGPSAAWLYVAGLCYCGRYLPDGFVPDGALPGMGQYGVLRARHLAGVLVTVGLWGQVDGGYQVHDYLEHQRSREEAESQRESKRRAGQAGGKQSARLRAETKGKQAG